MFILLFTKQFRTKRVSLLGQSIFPVTQTHTVLFIAVVCSFVEGKVCIVVLGNVMIKVSLEFTIESLKLSHLLAAHILLSDTLIYNQFLKSRHTQLL